MGSAARKIDVVDTSPRWTEADVARLTARFADTDTATMLRTAMAQRLLGRIAVVSSFGAESAVLLHLVAAADPATPVLFLDTGKHFPETLAYRDRLVAALGLVDVRVLTPDEAALAVKDGTGLRWSYDPDGCCELRKVEPLARGLAGFDAQLTGRKGWQSATRAGLPRFEIDTDGRLKVNPLANWSPQEVEAYLADHDLPRHPLVADGYPSIGCAPCTSRVKAGEDPRAGRWRGWDKVECGLHDAVPDDGSHDPAF